MESIQWNQRTTDKDDSNEDLWCDEAKRRSKITRNRPKVFKLRGCTKQFYNHYIAESSLARRLGVLGDRDVYTADHIPVEKNEDIVSGKRLYSIKLRNCTYGIRCTGTKSYVDSHDYEIDSSYFFLALANDPLWTLPPNLEIGFNDIKEVEQLLFLAIRPIFPGLRAKLGIQPSRGLLGRSTESFAKYCPGTSANEVWEKATRFGGYWLDYL